MKLYIASSFTNKVSVQVLIKKLEELGHTITHDWTIGSDTADQCLDGVYDCDVFIGLYDKPLVYQGSLIELGYAIAYDKRIYIIGDQIDRTIFVKELPEIVKCSNMNELIDKL